MRYSKNENVNGIVKNGFDYNLQVWVRDYKITLAGSISRTQKLKGFDIRELKNKGKIKNE